MNTIRSGKLCSFNNHYSIYEINPSKDTIYYLSIPNRNFDYCQLYLGFAKNDLNSPDKETIINEITTITDIVFGNDTEAIYIHLNIPNNRLTEAANVNDNFLYEQLLSTIHQITSNCYQTINENNNVTISNTLYLIKQDNEDIKLINWLELRLNNFVVGIDINKLKANIQTNEGGGTPKGFSGNGIANTNTKNNVLVKKLVPPKAGKHGYTTFTLIVLIIAIILGIGLAYLLIR